MENSVSVWQETVTLPSYPVGKPEKNPVFLEKRVYQGSSGVVYPHAVIEKIGDEKSDKDYIALFLENRYLKIMILPELGGRVHRAFDKIRQRDFVYYNSVIKPALVGLTGPWISGGIEFNWPQHHRPSTFSPLDFTIEENSDGSKTVWVNEVELMFRTKCQTGFTLYPDHAYLEVKGKIYNRTPIPQTFLWWANPAVKVNEHYQSVFPPDIHAVFDHGKREVSEFPIAKGTYYNVDYSPGTDISRYANIPVPTSYMAIQSNYDFIGGYEHDTRAGLLHVADHHISPGKKQWTWGCGEFGKAWDRNLTDEDGPYIELMTGMFTDNQPDFSWLQPYEEKTFEQYFMPYVKVGLVKNATKEAMINVETNGNHVSVIVFATSDYPGSKIRCIAEGGYGKHFVAHLSPLDAFEVSFDCPATIEAGSMTVTVHDAKGRLLVSFEPEPVREFIKPLPATAAKEPGEIETNEELFLNGLHLEQYRHATYEPMDYYEEALRRDPSDIRCNNAVGLWLMRHGQLQKAVSYFRQAIAALIKRNPNPYDGEPYYNLGICLAKLGKYMEAYDALYKSTWNDAWQHCGFLELAKIDLIRGRLNEALAHAEKSLVRNYHSHAARSLKAIILRKMRKYDNALVWIDNSLKIDPFGYILLFEGWQCCVAINNEKQGDEYLSRLRKLARSSANTYLEYAIDYGNAGCFEEAISLLEIYVNGTGPKDPMILYFLSYYSFNAGDFEDARKFAQQANACASDYCFPNKIEELFVLQHAVKENEGDAKAHYYLGNLWYGMRQYDQAIEAYKTSVAIDPDFPTAHRNLALLYVNKRKDLSTALWHMEKAFALDRTDARVMMELDQLYRKLNRTPGERLLSLETNLTLVEQRDDLYLERVFLMNCLGLYRFANELLLQRKFHPWEGGEGKVTGQFLFSRIMMAIDFIEQGDLHHASQLLEGATNYPENLGEGKLFGSPENDIHFLRGLVAELQGCQEEADSWFRKAAKGNSEPKPALFYNDPQPDKILYQGLAWAKLGEEEKAIGILNRLIEYGAKHMNDEVKLDYFAVSLPDMLVFDKDLNEGNKLHCIYLLALGELGLGNYENSVIHLNKILDADASHQGALRHLRMIDLLKRKI